jgi:hypothetical protein
MLLSDAMSLGAARVTSRVVPPLSMWHLLASFLGYLAMANDELKAIRISDAIKALEKRRAARLSSPLFRVATLLQPFNGCLELAAPRSDCSCSLFGHARRLEAQPQSPD